MAQVETLSWNLSTHTHTHTHTQNTEVMNLAKLCFRNDAEIKTYPSKQKLKEFIADNISYKKC
jgi:hypothetical protein